MRTSPHDSTGSVGGDSRAMKPRPQPLDLPRDSRYGTMDNTNIAGGNPESGGSRRGSRAGGTRDSTESAPLWNYVASPHSPLIKIRDHCHQQWVAVVMTLLLLAITVYFVFGLSAPMRAEQCVTPFGTLVGESGNIGAFSNCRNDYGGDRMDHFVSVGQQRLNTGAKWHALEYARRYWILSSLLTFASLPSADHIMTLDTATAVNGRRGGRGSSAVPLQRYTNMFLPRKVFNSDGEAVVLANVTGDANNVSAQALLMDRRQAMPEPRDLIVYAANRKTLPNAHVAVVVAVRGPYHSVADAGKDVRWYAVKNASSSGRQPLRPESDLPRQLLAKDGAAEAGSANKSKESTPETMGVLYYRVYIAEQNWDNAYWQSPRFLAEDDNAVRKGASNAARKTATKQRSYNRVLLLHEHAQPHGFFLEDTHNNLILGWVRAPNDETSG